MKLTVKWSVRNKKIAAVSLKVDVKGQLGERLLFALKSTTKTSLN